MTRTNGLELRTVVIGDQEYEKPYDSSCPVCRSPYHLQIDEMLAEGMTCPAITRWFAGRKPRPPRPEHIASHVDHLAEPHRKLRIQLQEAAELRGDLGEGSSLVQLSDVANAVVQRGFAAIAAGEMEISSRDLLAALKIAQQLEKDHGSSTSAESWQAVFVEMLGLVRKHMSPAQWQAFTVDVYASPAIRAALTDQPAIPAAGAPS